jgi:hypothetical protein
LAIGCSSSASSDLSVGAVTTIPNGTGTGSAASGTYTAQVNIVSCSGACTATFLGAPFAICTAGSAGSATITVVQTGGHLTAVTSSSNIIVQSFSGGIDADGSFDVGGVTDSVDGQPLTVTARATGSLAGSAMTATVEAAGTGTVNGSAIDCFETLDVTGARTGN